MGTLWLAVLRFVCQLHLILHELSKHNLHLAGSVYVGRVE